MSVWMMKTGVKMDKCVIVALACVCLVFIAAFATAQISRQKMTVSIEELKTENARLEKVKNDALSEVEFLRSAIKRLDAALSEANQAVTEIEETYNARTEQIHDLPADWLGCALPAGVCDMFAGYTVPGGSAGSGSTDAAVRAADSKDNADE